MAIIEIGGTQGLSCVVPAGILRVIAYPVGCGPGIIRRRKWRCAKLAAAGGVAEQLEPPAERSERREIGVARPAGLAGLAGETRQRLRRRGEAWSCENPKASRCEQRETRQHTQSEKVGTLHRAPFHYCYGASCIKHGRDGRGALTGVAAR